MTNTRVLLNLISLENKSKLQFVLRSQRSAISDSTFQVSTATRTRSGMHQISGTNRKQAGNLGAMLGRQTLQLCQGTLWQTFFVSSATKQTCQGMLLNSGADLTRVRFADSTAEELI